MKNEFKIIFTGGGSGGHTMPAISLINTLREYCNDNDIKLLILYVGSHTGIEKDIATRNLITYKSISTGKLRRYFSFKNFIDIFRILKGLIDSFFIIKKFKPDLLFSTGGFVSVPPVIIAKFLKVKTIIHEQTIDAGLANKIAGKFADKICVTFNESKKYFPQHKTIVTGIPLRKEIFLSTKEYAKKRYDFDYNRPTIFFTGGGLGCHLLNETAIKIIPKLLEKVNIIFQTGNANGGNDHKIMKNLFNELPEKTRKNFIVYNFINDELADILKLTDLAIARSGAGTVCEFIALKIPAIFIPLAIATNNEQYKNAMIMQSLGSAIILEEENLNENTLIDNIESILFTDKLSLMKNNFNNIENIDGREKILELILKDFN